jgi:hypothetical protein
MLANVVPRSLLAVLTIALLCSCARHLPASQLVVGPLWEDELRAIDLVAHSSLMGGKLHRAQRLRGAYTTWSIYPDEVYRASANDYEYREHFCDHQFLVNPTVDVKDSPVDLPPFDVKLMVNVQSSTLQVLDPDDESPDEPNAQPTPCMDGHAPIPARNRPANERADEPL